MSDLVAVDYSSMVKQRSLGPDNLDDGTDASSAFLDALRTRAMDDLLEAALEYGINLKDLGEQRVGSSQKHQYSTRPCSRDRQAVQG